MIADEARTTMMFELSPGQVPDPPEARKLLVELRVVVRRVVIDAQTDIAIRWSRGFDRAQEGIRRHTTFRMFDRHGSICA